MLLSRSSGQSSFYFGDETARRQDVRRLGFPQRRWRLEGSRWTRRDSCSGTPWRSLCAGCASSCWTPTSPPSPVAQDTCANNPQGSLSPLSAMTVRNTANGCSLSAFVGINKLFVLNDLTSLVEFDTVLGSKSDKIGSQTLSDKQSIASNVTRCSSWTDSVASRIFFL